MLFGRKKKIIVGVLSFLCVLLFSVSTYAIDAEKLRASIYISSTSVEIIPQGNGILLLENKLAATRKVDKLGMVSLQVQTRPSGYWQTQDTIVTDDYRYNTSVYTYDCYYLATPGTEYRTYVTFYVENDGGSETRVVTSTPEYAR